MKDGKFEASDLYRDTGDLKCADGLIVEHFNALLPQLHEQWLAELLWDAPVVYGYQLHHRRVADKPPLNWDLRAHVLDTHSARLVDITPLVKEKK